MLFSSYVHLKRSKYFVYFLIDLGLSYVIYQYMADAYTSFDWLFFAKIYSSIILLQLVLALRDGFASFIFFKTNQRELVEGMVKHFNRLNYPKGLEGVYSSNDYFEKIVTDAASAMSLKLDASKFLQLLSAIRNSSSGWVNHCFYTILLKESINQYIRG